MVSTNARAGRFMAAGFPVLVASFLLSRADQPVFGMPSDFWAGFMLVMAIGSLVMAIALSVGSFGSDASS